MSTTKTFLFQEVFANYSEFKEMTDDLQLYEPDDAVSEAFNQYLFNIIYLRWKGNSINYGTINEFKMSFSFVYVDIFAKYKMQKQLIDKVQKLTDEELEILSDSISNGAYNPNTAPEKPFDLIRYISSQNATRLKSSKLVAYLNAIKNAPTLNVREMTDAFEDLFMLIIPMHDYYFRRKKSWLLENF